MINYSQAHKYPEQTTVISLIQSISSQLYRWRKRKAISWRLLSILGASQSSIGRNKASAACKQDGMDLINGAETIPFSFQAIRLVIERPRFMR